MVEIETNEHGIHYVEGKSEEAHAFGVHGAASCYLMEGEGIIHLVTASVPKEPSDRASQRWVLGLTGDEALAVARMLIKVAREYKEKCE